MHALQPLCTLDLSTLPAGTVLERTINGVSFYRVAWLIAVQEAALYYVGDHGATDQIERLTGIDDQVELLTRQLEALVAEKAQLISTLIPASQTPVPAKANAKRAHKPYARPEPGPLVVCGIDGCTVEKPEGRSLNMHRVRVHPAWVARQQLLSDDDPRKIGLGAALPAVREVAADSAPFTPAFTPRLH
jgi:hypothetical protein